MVVEVPSLKRSMLGEMIRGQRELGQEAQVVDTTADANVTEIGTNDVN